VDWVRGLLTAGTHRVRLLAPTGPRWPSTASDFILADVASDWSVYAEAIGIHLHPMPGSRGFVAPSAGKRVRLCLGGWQGAYGPEPEPTLEETPTLTADGSPPGASQQSPR